MYFVGSLARFGGYRNNTSVSTPRAPGWVTFFATAARPRNIHLDRALGGCQHERNINGRAGRGPVSIFLTNRRESLHQQQTPAPRALLLTNVSEYAVPEELQARLDAAPEPRAAFEALTPRRRKSYIFHIAGAKQVKTRAARAERCVPMILSGRGFNELTD
ncbi:YdeI/OmpD-associated family protein [Bradyrhizobium sp.]|uniref:YdeI/OmpD-associated family protein n=1 Tax=Bradyrhizobium sp. TaxID=376 RepID=UPI003C6F8C45